MTLCPSLGPWHLSLDVERRGYCSVGVCRVPACSAILVAWIHGWEASVCEHDRQCGAAGIHGGKWPREVGFPWNVCSRVRRSHPWKLSCPKPTASISGATCLEGEFCLWAAGIQATCGPPVVTLRASLVCLPSIPGAGESGKSTIVKQMK